MFGNLGFGELMIILVIVLVLFGAKRVPGDQRIVRKGHSRVQEEHQRRRARGHASPSRDVASDAIASAPASRRCAATMAEEARPEPKRLI